jgi:hypothetical protein
MKIEGPNRATSVGKSDKAKKTGGTSASGFADYISGTEESESAPAPVSVAGVSLFAALQAAEHATNHDNRRRAIDNASDLLDDLEDLRIGLLLGSYTINQLQQLSARVRQQRLMVNDPKMMSLLDDIALRAAVELAKYES